ncbi:MAG TPA: FAD:protein FMN transferase, partial [Planctomycetota bacterium]|nr:FAD:protein FMN transferase [Planctomycetota bacterium]
MWLLHLLIVASCGREDSASATSALTTAATTEQSASAPAAPEAPPLRHDGTLFAESELMGTRVSINVYVGETARAAAAATAIREAFAEISRIESIASEWQADSALSRLNAGAGGPAQRVPPELFEILSRASKISRDSEGRFDVTFHAVGALWSFRPGARPPSAEAVREKLPLVNWAAVELDEDRGEVRLPLRGMKIGLGAIAKGYA